MACVATTRSWGNETRMVNRNVRPRRRQLSNSSTNWTIAPSRKTIGPIIQITRAKNVFFRGQALAAAGA